MRFFCDRPGQILLLLVVFCEVSSLQISCVRGVNNLEKKLGDASDANPSPGETAAVDAGTLSPAETAAQTPEPEAPLAAVKKSLSNLTNDTSCLPTPVVEADLFTSYDVAYAVIDGQTLTLDIAAPKDLITHPLVLVVHGGGYSSGDKKDERRAILTLAARGYVAASVNYRLSSPNRNHFPAQIQDVRCALRWLRINAATYGIDPQRVAAQGNSAGGSLVELLATAPSVTDFDHPDCPIAPAAASIELDAVIGNAGRVDVRLDPEVTPAAADGIVTSLFGFDPRSRPGPATDDLVESASAITHVSKDAPPFLLIHGKRDPLVFSNQYEEFASALEEAEVEVFQIDDDRWGHAPPIFSADPLFRRALCASMRFLDHHLRHTPLTSVTELRNLAKANTVNSART